MSNCWCGPTQDSGCAYSTSELQCLNAARSCFWQCQSRGGGGQLVIVHNGDNSDAGDAAASLIGSIFTFFLFLFLAGCCVACCAVRYCMLKAQTAPEQSRTPSSFSGWLKSAVVRPAPTPLLVHADCTSPAQIHTCVLPEAPPLADDADRQGQTGSADCVCRGGRCAASARPRREQCGQQAAATAPCRVCRHL